MRLSIIIVNWNTGQGLLDCLRSIERHPPASQFEVIVIAKASTDGALGVLRQDFPQVTVIPNEVGICVLGR